MLGPRIDALWPHCVAINISSTCMSSKILSVSPLWHKLYILVIAKGRCSSSAVIHAVMQSYNSFLYIAVHFEWVSRCSDFTIITGLIGYNVINNMVVT